MKSLKLRYLSIALLCMAAEAATSTGPGAAAVVDATTAPAAPAPATKAKKEKPPKPEKPALVKQNGITRPADMTKGTGRIWAIADEVSAKKGSPAARSEVMEIAKAENINEATIATQYGKWRNFNGLKGQTITKTPEPAAAPAAGVAEAGAAADAAAAA